MVEIFKQKNPISFLLLFVIGIAIKLPMFVHLEAPVSASIYFPLYGLILKWLTSFMGPSGLGWPIATFILLYLQAAVLIQLSNAFRLFPRQNYLIGLSYFLLSSLLPGFNVFSEVLLVNCFLLYVLYGVFKIYHLQNAKPVIFNIGLALGLSAFIDLPILILTIWLLIAISIVRPFKVAEWLICLLGIITPFYFYMAYIIFNGRWDWFKNIPPLSLKLFRFHQLEWELGAFSICLLAFIGGYYYTLDNRKKIIISIRSYWNILLMFFLFSIVFIGVNLKGGYQSLLISFIPLSAFLAALFYYIAKKWARLAVFWLIVVFILLFQYAGRGWQ